MQEIVELIPHAMPPITENGRYQFDGCAIAFQNVGNADAVINNFYTLKQGGSLQFSVSNELNTIITGQWIFKFLAGSNPLVEIMLLVPSKKEFSNYVQK